MYTLSTRDDQQLKTSHIYSMHAIPYDRYLPHTQSFPDHPESQFVCVY